MGDSQLVIKQINHEYKVLELLDLEPLYDSVIGMLSEFTNFKFSYIPRDKKYRS